MAEEIPLDIDGYASEYTGESLRELDWWPRLRQAANNPDIKLPGRTAITRLLVIAKHAQHRGARLRALLLAIQRVKTATLDFELYGNLMEDLNSYRQGHGGLAEDSGSFPQVLDGINVMEGLSDLEVESSGRIDEEWLSSTTQQVKKLDDKLEAEMRNYSVNLIKESIRVS